MVRRLFSAFLALLPLLFSGVGYAKNDPRVQTSQEFDAAGNSSITHRINYQRRQFLQDGNQFYICNGKYLSYKNNQCAPAYGVDRQTAERPLLADIRERFGQDARIVKAFVQTPAGQDRQLVVLISTFSEVQAEAELNTSINLITSYQDQEWIKVGNNYFTCPDGEVIELSGEHGCKAKQGLLAWLGGREDYYQPISLQSHIQQKTSFPVKVVKIEETKESGLRVTYSETAEYDNAIKAEKTPPLIGNNRPKAFQGTGDAWLADLLVAITFITAMTFMFIDMTQKRYRYSAFGLGCYVIISASLNGFNFLLFFILAIADRSIHSEVKRIRENLANLASRRAEAESRPARVSESRQATSLEALRELQERRNAISLQVSGIQPAIRPQVTNEAQSASTLAVDEAQTANPVRKIVLD